MLTSGLVLYIDHTEPESEDMMEPAPYEETNPELD
jgi:hypothetical protein